MVLNRCDNFKKYTSGFIKNYDENNNLGYLLEVDIEYLKNIHETYRNLPFLPIKKDK